MTTLYLYDNDGYFAGTCSGLGAHPNSTELAPPEGEEKPQFIDGAWVQHIVSTKVSPVQFKLLFHVLERVAIKESKDPIVMDFFEIVNDPRLTFVDLGLMSTHEALHYLEEVGLIGEGRASQILIGAIQ